MKRSYIVLTSISWFGTGILQPVFLLVLLSHGCTYQTIAIALGFFSMARLCFEIPSGVLADRRGRKQMYLFSMLLYIISFSGLMFSRHLGSAIIAMVLQGIARAFSSGSLDALIIDDYVEQNGNDHISFVTSKLLVIQSVSLAIGALVGGLLPNLKNYSFHLLFRIILLLVAFLLCKHFIYEKNTPSVSYHIQSKSINLSLIKNNHTLVKIILSTIILCMGLTLLENYWQPAFKDLYPSNQNISLGILSTLSFLLLTSGSLIAGKIKISQISKVWYAYFLLQISLGIVLVFIALQTKILGFSFFYLFFYLLLDISNVQEQNLINHLANAKNRASILSIASFIGQLGTFITCMISTLFISYLHFNGLWLVGGIFIAVVGGIMFARHFLYQKRVQKEVFQQK